MPDPNTSVPAEFTPDMAEKLPDNELKAGHQHAEHAADEATNPDEAADAERKAEIAEEEMTRRGTSDT